MEELVRNSVLWLMVGVWLLCVFGVLKTNLEVLK